MCASALALRRNVWSLTNSSTSCSEILLHHTLSVLWLTKKKKHLERECQQHAPRSAHQQHQFVGASTSSSQPPPSTTQSCKAICGTSMMLMPKTQNFGASTSSSDQLRHTDNGARRQGLSDLLHDVTHTLVLRPHLKQRCGEHWAASTSSWSSSEKYQSARGFACPSSVPVGLRSSWAMHATERSGATLQLRRLRRSGARAVATA